MVVQVFATPNDAIAFANGESQELVVSSRYYECLGGPLSVSFDTDDYKLEKITPDIKNSDSAEFKVKRKVKKHRPIK